jgi:Domain of Unknown Function with PDB structure (DUF3857)
MKHCIIFVLFFLSVSFSLQAQSYRTPAKIDSDWVAVPKLHAAQKEYLKESAIVLTEKDNFEYKYEGKGNYQDEGVHAGLDDYKYQSKGMSIYHTYHRTIKIMSELGIEQYNTVTIPFNHAAVIYERDLKARTITPSGKVYNLAPHNFKVEGNKILFAMEGVEKFAEVEVYLTELMSYTPFLNVVFEQHIPVLDYTLTLGYPKELLIEEKGKNGFPDGHDTVIAGRRHMKIHMNNIPKLEPEPFNFFYPYQMRAEWRSSYWSNDYGAEGRQFTWDEYAKKLYTDIFQLSDKKALGRYFLNPNGIDYYYNDTERRAVNGFLASIGITGSEKELDKILKIEKAIKNSVSVFSVTEDNSGRLDTIISRKTATVKGVLKLYAACFAQSDVKCEIGCTTDKTYHLFNSVYENWDDLDEFVIYFPNQKEYLAPTRTLLRYPMVPIDVLENRAVFCKMNTPAESRPRVADIRTIPSPSPLENNKNIVANVTFNKNMEPYMDISYAYGGYMSVQYRDNFNAVTNSVKQREMVEKMITVAERPSDVLKYNLSNTSIDDYYTKEPFILTANVRSPQLVEKAGNRFKFNIGSILGELPNLYHEKERKLPVDLSFPNSLNCTITVNIPAGYKVLNLNALETRMEYFDRENKKIPLCSFKTDYSVKNNKLVLNVSAVFAQSHIRLRDYESFKKVVNAAADFNKVAIIIGR